MNRPELPQAGPVRLLKKSLPAWPHVQVDLDGHPDNDPHWEPKLANRHLKAPWVKIAGQDQTEPPRSCPAASTASDHPELGRVFGVTTDMLRLYATIFRFGISRRDGAGDIAAAALSC
jgi:hypothetical protein